MGIIHVNYLSRQVALHPWLEARPGELCGSFILICHSHALPPLHTFWGPIHESMSIAWINVYLIRDTCCFQFLLQRLGSLKVIRVLELARFSAYSIKLGNLAIIESALVRLCIAWHLTCTETKLKPCWFTMFSCIVRNIHIFLLQSLEPFIMEGSYGFQNEDMLNKNT